MWWIVDKWTNNVNLKKDKLAPVKNYFINGRIIMGSGGFPDFLCFKRNGKNYKVIAVESKIVGELDREEKLKCKWYIDNKIFDDVFIASKIKVNNRVNVILSSFKTKYKKWWASEKSN